MATEKPKAEEARFADACRLLRWAQEFVGVKTSREEQEPHLTYESGAGPESEGARLRRLAAKADGRDILIIAIREFLKEAHKAMLDSVLVEERDGV